MTVATSTEPGLARDLETALAIARDAAAVVRGYWRTPLDVSHKSGDEPVTAADHAANDLIVGRLAAAFPGDAILSEELPDDGSRLGARRAWMVDPIDGTRDFIAGREGFAVMIGLAVEGRPALGVVCQPSTGLSWAGALGAGGFREERTGERRPLRVSAIAGPPGIRLVASKSHRIGEIDAFRRALGITDELAMGGVGLKIGLIAEGSRDLYIYPGRRTKIWDTCAPEAILHEAGGRMTDAFGGPLVYTDPDTNNRRGVVASNGPLHALALDMLARMRG